MYLVFPAGSDFRVVLGASVQIVVVGCQTSRPQLCSLLRCEHAQCGAYLHIEAANLANHVKHSLPLPLANLQPQINYQ